MDLLRGLAAIAVLVGHVRGLFFVDLGNLSSPSPSMRLLYLLTGYGHQAVVVFFVLSGFFIGTSVLGSTSRGEWSWGSYLLRRFTRLYVVLIPALLLTALLDLAGMHFFGVNNVYGARLNAPFITLDDAQQTTRLGCFLGNLAFLQDLVVRPYGTNGPLWSLGYEFWSYITFPLLVLATLRSSSVATRLACVLAATPIVFLGRAEFARYLGIWLLGVAVSASWRRVATWSVPSWAGWPALLALAVGLTGARIAHTHLVLWDYGASAVTAGFLVTLLARTGSAGAASGRSAYGRFATRLAGFSYTLYLIHFPIVAIVNAALVGVDRWQPTAGKLACGAGLTGGILAVAYLLAHLTERHTEDVRRHAEALLLRLRSWFAARATKSA